VNTVGVGGPAIIDSNGTERSARAEGAMSTLASALRRAFDVSGLKLPGCGCCRPETRPSVTIPAIVDHPPRQEHPAVERAALKRFWGAGPTPVGTSAHRGNAPGVKE